MNAFTHNAHTHTPLHRSHLDLYCPLSDCPRYGNTKYNDTNFEVKRNQWFAWNYIFYDIPDDQVCVSVCVWLVLCMVESLSLSCTSRANEPLYAVRVHGDDL